LGDTNPEKKRIVFCSDFIYVPLCPYLGQHIQPRCLDMKIIKKSFCVNIKLCGMMMYNLKNYLSWLFTVHKKLYTTSRISLECFPISCVIPVLIFFFKFIPLHAFICRPIFRILEHFHAKTFSLHIQGDVIPSFKLVKLSIFDTRILLLFTKNVHITILVK